MEEKKGVGRPSVPSYKKQVVVSFRLLKVIADVYPAERIKKVVIDLYNGDEELGMVSKSVKDVSKPSGLVEDKIAKARKALEMAESKQSLNQHQKNTIEAFGAVVVNPYAHNKEGHQLCDRLFALLEGRNVPELVFRKVREFLGEMEDMRDRGA